jgi:hypothetical protein
MGYMLELFVVTLVGLLLHHPQLAPSPTLPNPFFYPESCGNGQQKRAICNPDEVIREESASKLHMLLSGIKAGTSNACGDGDHGYEVAVALQSGTMKRKWWWDSTYATATRTAKDIFNAWGVGHAGCNNGVLLFLSVADRKTYLKTGKGAKAKLTDDMAYTILNNPAVKDLMRKGDFETAVQRIIESVGLALGFRVPETPLTITESNDGCKLKQTEPTAMLSGFHIPVLWLLQWIYYSLVAWRGMLWWAYWHLISDRSFPRLRWKLDEMEKQVLGTKKHFVIISLSVSTCRSVTTPQRWL